MNTTSRVKESENIFLSITINADTAFKQIEPFIEERRKACILMKEASNETQKATFMAYIDACNKNIKLILGL